MTEKGSGKAEIPFRGQFGKMWHSVHDDDGGVTWVFDFCVKVEDMPAFLRALEALSMDQGSPQPATDQVQLFDITRVPETSIVQEIDPWDKAHREATSAACWGKMFELLGQFKELMGHCKVPQLHVVDEDNLGIWVKDQRSLKKKGTLDPNREKRLEGIDFTWSVFHSWDEHCVMLRQFKQLKGRCTVPWLHVVDENNLDLGTWVNTQRKNHFKGTLDPNREEQLKRIGFTWDVQSALWESMFVLLQQFKQLKGHCNVHRSHVVDEANLGTWVNTQRSSKKKKTLELHRVEQLQRLDFTWDAQLARWESVFFLLQQFKQLKGHCNVPRSHGVDEDNLDLGAWVNTQRSLEKKKTLEPDRVEQLQRLGFTWRKR
jgi:hypothetical protein